MNIIEMSVDELTPYENNPRNNDDAVQYVANSIQEFGFKVPIVIDKDNVIVAGHTRLKAAKMLGLDKVPVIVADDLTENQVKAFRLADNKVGELADWDFSKLEEELAEIDDIDMSDFGFDEYAKSEKKEKEVNLKDDVIQIVVDCESEIQAEEYYNQIKGMGIECRISTL